MADTETVTLSEDELEEIRGAFHSIDANESGYIELSELKDAFERVHLRLPAYKIRDLLRANDSSGDNKLDLQEFINTVISLKQKENLNFTKLLSRQSGVETIPGLSDQTADDVTHSVTKAEKHAFSDWINRNFVKDPECAQYLPIKKSKSEEGVDFYEAQSDGILLCKMINLSSPDTIDERVINKGDNLSLFKKHENQTLVLQSALSIGCSIVNIGPQDLIDGRPHLVLGLMWQIIKLGLLNDINLHEHTELAILLQEGETLGDLQKLSPEEILMRWVNYHLERAGTNRRISNFSTDIMDSEIYLHLLQQISPAEANVLTRNAFQEDDRTDRAEMMLREADKIQCRVFVTPQDVVNGNSKLNLAFVANLFNNYPALDSAAVNPEDMDIIGETREEKKDIGELFKESREELTFRNWINSTGDHHTGKRYVYHLYSDLCDGIVILQMFDKIEKGCVQWKQRVTLPPFPKISANFKKLGNCNYCIELGKQFRFSLVGIGGNDIAEMNNTLTMALVWQMIRAYTLNILMNVSRSSVPVSDNQIVQWANNKLESAGKENRFKSFKDNSLRDGKAIIDLVDAIKPKSVRYELVTEGNTDEEMLSNAKYAINVARKAGAAIYALPEDIVEVKPKMMMTIFAFLNLLDLTISTGTKDSVAI